MDFRQLNTFMTIAKLQSFSKAAEELGYAQSSISSQIQLLEQELKVRLFERLGHNITLTAEGSKLLPLAEQILKLSMEAKSIAGNQEKPSGSLIIGAIETLCVSRLPNLLKEYRTRYPDVEIILKFGSTSDFLRSMKENTIDIAFFIDRKIINDDYIIVWQKEEPMALLCAPEHAFAGKEEVFPEDLSGEPLILTEPCCGYRALFDSIMSQFHIKPRSVIETGNVQAIKQLTLSGMGITFLPVAAIEEELGQKKFVKLNWMGPDFPVFTQVLYHKSKWMSAALKAFIDLIKEQNCKRQTF
jgi:DNA-binding transcriptional LysR family regulator